MSSGQNLWEESRALYPRACRMEVLEMGEGQEISRYAEPFSVNVLYFTVL